MRELQGFATPVGKKISTLRVVFFYHSPCINRTDPVKQGIMFKFLFRVRLGSRWLLAGIRTSGSPFFIGVHYVGFKEYTLRILWLECCLTELPF